MESSSRKFSREVDGRGRKVEGPDHIQWVLFQNWGGNEPNHTVTCMLLKVTANDRHTIQPFAMMNFVGLDLTPPGREIMTSRRANKEVTRKCHMPISSLKIYRMRGDKEQ
ncbi:hypothetical protein TNCV_658831 [Trichonephila clavipes]|nr:hypothetical protein TNCV_658831 [Trichonephila clavipes]